VQCGEKLLMEGIDVADIVARLRPPANDRSMYSSKVSLRRRRLANAPAIWLAQGRVVVRAR